jgi:hypothetical protein
LGAAGCFFARDCGDTHAETQETAAWHKSLEAGKHVAGHSLLLGVLVTDVKDLMCYAMSICAMQVRVCCSRFPQGILISTISKLLLLMASTHLGDWVIITVLL